MLEDKVAQEIRKFHEAVTKLQEKEGSLLGSYFSSGYAPDRSAERSHQTPENLGEDIGKNGEIVSDIHTYLKQIEENILWFILCA